MTASRSVGTLVALESWEVRTHGLDADLDARRGAGWVPAWMPVRPISRARSRFS